jgi:hypothetical protein
MTSYFWRRWADGGKLQLSAVTRDSVLFNRIFSTGGRLNRSEIFEIIFPPIKFAACFPFLFLYSNSPVTDFNEIGTENGHAIFSLRSL